MIDGPSQQRGARISLKALSKQFTPGAVPAVDQIDLEMEPGEFLTLLGPSGSGKTTTLNMVAGFLDPSGGQIELNGRDISNIPPHRRNFGMVFQNYALFPHLTVEQNIAFPLKQRRVPRAERGRRVREALDLVQLSGMDSRKPSQLSGGQQQRVALARAVVFSPHLLLLDEPLGALDRKLRQSLQAEIKRIHRELGLTFVFVTHDQDEAMSLSDRIAVFNEGRIERVGTPRALYDDPGTLFVAEFMGESNRFFGAAKGAEYEWAGSPMRTAASRPGADDDVLVVRPERIGIAASPGDVPSGANSAPATVVDSSYLGIQRRVDLEYADGTRGVAVLPGSGSSVPSTGAGVVVHWHPQDQVFVRRRPPLEPAVPVDRRAPSAAVTKAPVKV